MKNFHVENNQTTYRTDTYQRYISDIRGFKVMPATEINNLLISARNGNERARNTIIEHHLLLVVKIARHYQNRGVELSDLISGGNIGLIKAINTYKESEGATFATYAARAAQSEIIKTLLNMVCVVELPNNKMWDEETTLYNVSTENKLSNSDNETTLGEMLVGDNDYLQADNTKDGDLSTEISRILANILTNREEKVIRLYFGIGCHQESLRTIANLIGYTYERTRQIREQAIRKLQESPYVTRLAEYLVG